MAIGLNENLDRWQTGVINVLVFFRTTIPTRKVFLLLVIVSLLLLLLAPGIAAQEIDLEELLDTDAESEEQSELVEYLQHLLYKPLDLNRVSAEELQTIPWISPMMAHRIVRYREKIGGYTDPSQLMEVPGINAETFKIIKYFVKIYVSSKPLHGFATSRQRLITRFEEPRGYTQNIYAGSMHKYYNRATLGINEFMTIGGLLEKDLGERRLDDLALWFIKIQVPDLNAKILCGNYKFEVGQGLIFWGPYGFGKSNNAIAPIKKRARGLREYLSVDENAALHGVAFSTRKNSFQFTGLYSRT